MRVLCSLNYLGTPKQSLARGNVGYIHLA